MNYEITGINEALREDMAAGILAFEQNYHQQVETIARAILAGREKSPVVLLAGPSGSSKTTTGQRLREKITALGVPAHLISMDNYYVDWDEPDFPRLQNGERDLESPMCLNIPLLNEHFSLLETGADIHVPIYDFPTHKPLEGEFIPMSPSHGDIFIFEGIHALNPLFTEKHPEAFRLYISPAASFTSEGRVICTPQTLRLMRRVVRDHLFRGAEAEFSLSLWSNVLSGDKLYIEPYRDTAHGIINTTMGYELGALKPYVLPLFRALPEDVPCREQVEAALQALEYALEVPHGLVPEDSIIREFIG